MASTLAGNFTVLGSIANPDRGTPGGGARGADQLWDYFRVGAPLTVITLAVARLAVVVTRDAKRAITRGYRATTAWTGKQRFTRRRAIQSDT